MIPQNRLSTTPVLGYYLSPDDLDPMPHIDYELGGIGLSDPSAGMQYQVWTATLEPIPFTNNQAVYIEAPNTPKTLLFQQNNISQISLAFDQNMHPFIAFVQNGQARFWWFDPLIPGQTFTTMAVDVTSPMCTLDDKRRLHVSTSDIILAYVRSGNLYFRMQRDRYTIEYLLKTAVTGDMIRVGMSSRNRLQFALGAMDPAPPPNPIYRITVPGDRRITVNGDNRKTVGGAP